MALANISLYPWQGRLLALFLIALPLGRAVMLNQTTVSGKPCASALVGVATCSHMGDQLVAGVKIFRDINSPGAVGWGEGVPLMVLDQASTCGFTASDPPTSSLPLAGSPLTARVTWDEPAAYGASSTEGFTFQFDHHDDTPAGGNSTLLVHGDAEEELGVNLLEDGCTCPLGTDGWGDKSDLDDFTVNHGVLGPVNVDCWLSGNANQEEEQLDDDSFEDVEHLDVAGCSAGMDCDEVDGTEDIDSYIDVCNVNYNANDTTSGNTTDAALYLDNDADINTVEVANPADLPGVSNASCQEMTGMDAVCGDGHHDNAASSMAPDMCPLSEYMYQDELDSEVDGADVHDENDGYDVNSTSISGAVFTYYDMCPFLAHEDIPVDPVLLQLLDADVESEGLGHPDAYDDLGVLNGTGGSGIAAATDMCPLEDNQLDSEVAGAEVYEVYDEYGASDASDTSDAYGGNGTSSSGIVAAADMCPLSAYQDITAHQVLLMGLDTDHNGHHNASVDDAHSDGTWIVNWPLMLNQSPDKQIDTDGDGLAEDSADEVTQSYWGPHRETESANISITKLWPSNRQSVRPISISAAGIKPDGIYILRSLNVNSIWQIGLGLHWAQNKALTNTTRCDDCIVDACMVAEQAKAYLCKFGDSTGGRGKAYHLGFLAMAAGVVIK